MEETTYTPQPLYTLNTKDGTFCIETHEGLSQLLNNTNEVTLKYYSKTQKVTITMAELFRKEMHESLDKFLDKVRDGTDR